jgi:hypothetical protein
LGTHPSSTQQLERASTPRLAERLWCAPAPWASPAAGDEIWKARSVASSKQP